jgi:glycosyltransferase involved in cell wall biosynthesis
LKRLLYGPERLLPGQGEFCILRRMRLFYCTLSTNKSGGGRQALYLARGMQERGHTVAFFLPESSTLRQLAPDWPGWRPLASASSWRAALEEALRAGQGPAVVHAFHNQAMKRLAWWGIFWKRRVACFAQRGVLFRPGNPLPYWSPGIDCFVANSAACAGVLRSMGLAASRVRVVQNAIPDERLSTTTSRGQMRAALGLAPGDLVFGAVADKSPVKGAAILLRAFAGAFPASGFQGLSVRLLIKGVTDKILPAELGSSPVLERVRLLPWGNDVADFLSALDIFVLPSLSESMPNTLLEAVCLGLPAIGSRVGAVPEILASCGMLVPPGDVSALAAAMRALADDPALLAGYAAAAGSQRELYRQESRLDKMEALYAEFLLRKGF